MKRLLPIVFFFCTAFAFGQGAATPALAWDNSAVGNEKDFWFELDTIASTTVWVKGINATNSSLKMLFNTNVDASPNVVNSGTSIQSTFDQSFYDLSGSGCAVDFSWTTYEEWYLIKVPSSGNIKIILTEGTGNNLPYGTTIQWYEFIATPPTIPLCSNQDDSFIRATKESSNNSPELIFDLARDKLGAEKINGNYILFRLGNIDYSAIAVNGEILSSYTITVSTHNNKCENALEAPISAIGDIEGEYIFSSSTIGTDKELLNNNYPALGTVPTTLYGSTDYSSSTNNKNGTWFKTNANASSTFLYAATCGSTKSPELLVFSQCPTSGGLIAGENLNIDNGGALPDFNEDWNRDICLIPSNNVDWPVIRFPNTGVEYYYFLFNNEDSKYNFFVFDDSHFDQGGILPVELIDFNGIAFPNYNKLKWVTASEQQNDYFILEKSSDAENYQRLAQIPGSGNSAFENHYEFDDRDPFVTTYYRLSQVDWDGSEKMLKEIALNNETISTHFSIKNNPIVDGYLNIRCFSLDEKELSIKIFSLSGKLVYSNRKNINKKTTLLSMNISFLQNGIYIVKMEAGIEVFNEKIIIQTIE